MINELDGMIEGWMEGWPVGWTTQAESQSDRHTDIHRDIRTDTLARMPCHAINLVSKSVDLYRTPGYWS